MIYQPIGYAFLIKTETELKAAKGDVEALSQGLQLLTATLKSRRLASSEIQKLTQPQQTELSKLQQQIDWFLAAKKGEVVADWPFTELGKMLILLRIARGLTQKQLADRLKVKPALISKDELREYQGLSVERLGRILEALDAKSFLHLELPKKPVPAAAKTDSLTTKPEPKPRPALEMELELVVACKSVTSGLGSQIDKSLKQIDELLGESLGAMMITEKRKLLERRRLYRFSIPENEASGMKSKVSNLDQRCSDLAAVYKCKASLTLLS